MTGTHLARWTLAWFAAALGFLVLTLLLALVLAPAPGAWRQPEGLALVHLIALGWLGHAMTGALIQFLPVLLVRPLPWPGLSLLALLAMAAGVWMLAVGFLALSGWPEGVHLLIWAPLPLGLGFGLLITMAAVGLIGARGWRDDTGRMVILALLALVLVWISGSGMARMLGGAGWPGLTAIVLPLHAAAGIAGWLGLAAMGVSFRLFAMFLLSPDDGRRFRPAMALLGVIMIAAIGCGIALKAPVPAAVIAAVSGLGLVGLYLADQERMWRRRNRPRPEVNMTVSLSASGFLAMAVLLWIAALRQGGGPLAEAAVFAALIGWLSSLTLAQMVKITSFLTWIQVFAPRLGRGKLPLVTDLVDESAARHWLWLWLIGAGLGTASLLAAQPLVFRAAILALLLAALGILRQVWHIRRLHHLNPSQRPAALPPLFLPPSMEPHRETRP